MEETVKKIKYDKIVTKETMVRPCFKCGELSEVELVSATLHDLKINYVVCGACMTAGPRVTDAEEAVALWNMVYEYENAKLRI